MEASKAFKLHANHETLWAYFSSSTARSEGCVWKYEQVRWTPCRFSPPDDTIGVEGGEAVHREDVQWSCPEKPARRGVTPYTTYGAR